MAQKRAKKTPAKKAAKKTIKKTAAKKPAARAAKKPAKQSVKKSAQKVVARKSSVKKGSARSTLRPRGTPASSLPAPLDSPRFVPPLSWNAAGKSATVPPFPPEPIKRPEPRQQKSSSTLTTRPLHPSVSPPSPIVPSNQSSRSVKSSPAALSTPIITSTSTSTPSPLTTAKDAIPPIAEPKIVTSTTESRSERRRSSTKENKFLSRMGARSIPVGAFIVAVGAAVIFFILALTSGGAGGVLSSDSGTSSTVSVSEVEKLATQMKSCDKTIAVIQGLAKRSATAGGSAAADELLAADTSLEATCAQLRSTIERISARGN